MGTDDLLRLLLACLLSAASGFLGAVAVFRARLQILEIRITAESEQRGIEREHDKEMLELELKGIREVVEKSDVLTRQAHQRIERRQAATLELLVNIGNASGLNKRLFPDTINAILATDKGEGV